MKAKNGHITYESYARTTLIDVKIAIFLSYIKCYFQWNSPVKWHTVIVRSYSLISNYVLYSVANIIFISRFKCVVHHFKLFAVEWRYSFAVEWRFTKPKSKKKITRFANVSIEYMVPRARMVFNENFLFSWFESSWSVKSSFYRTEQYWWTESRLLY